MAQDIHTYIHTVMGFFFSLAYVQNRDSRQRARLSHSQGPSGRQSVPQHCDVFDGCPSPSRDGDPSPLAMATACVAALVFHVCPSPHAHPPALGRLTRWGHRRWHRLDVTWICLHGAPDTHRNVAMRDIRRRTSIELARTAIEPLTFDQCEACTFLRGQFDVVGVAPRRAKRRGRSSVWRGATAAPAQAHRPDRVWRVWSWCW